MCFPRKKSTHTRERKSPLLGAQTVSLPLSARSLGRKNDHKHNTISNASLCAAAAEKPRKDSLSLSYSRREKETSYFFGLFGLFPVYFLPFQKVLLNAHHALFCSLLLSLSLSHTHTQTAASCEDETMICDTALLFAHSSEFSVRTKKESAKRRHMSFNFCLKTPKIDDARSKEGRKNFRLREKRKKRDRRERERKRGRKKCQKHERRRKKQEKRAKRAKREKKMFIQ